MSMQSSPSNKRSNDDDLPHLVQSNNNNSTSKKQKTNEQVVDEVKSSGFKCSVDRATRQKWLVDSAWESYSWVDNFSAIDLHKFLDSYDQSEFKLNLDMFFPQVDPVSGSASPPSFMSIRSFVAFCVYYRRNDRLQELDELLSIALQANNNNLLQPVMVKFIYDHGLDFPKTRALFPDKLKALGDSFYRLFALYLYTGSNNNQNNNNNSSTGKVSRIPCKKPTIKWYGRQDTGSFVSIVFAKEAVYFVNFELAATRLKKFQMRGQTVILERTPFPSCAPSFPIDGLIRASDLSRFLDWTLAQTTGVQEVAMAHTNDWTSAEIIPTLHFCLGFVPRESYWRTLLEDKLMVQFKQNPENFWRLVYAASRFNLINLLDSLLEYWAAGSDVARHSPIYFINNHKDKPVSNRFNCFWKCTAPEILGLFLDCI